MLPVLIAVAVLRAVLVASVGVLAVWCMHERRGGLRAAEIERRALILFASGGIGVTLLLLRRVLVWLTTNSAESPWWLLYRSPDISGWTAYSVCECFIVVGAIMLVYNLIRRKP